MHHGYYPTPDFRDHQAAQRLMIEKSLEYAYKKPFPQFSGKKMVDVGCGVGGSSRYIVKKYGGSAEGLSLSPYQVQRANAFSAKVNLSHALHYQVADAMNMPFPNNSFDLSAFLSLFLSPNVVRTSLIARVTVDPRVVCLCSMEHGIWRAYA